MTIVVTLSILCLHAFPVASALSADSKYGYPINFTKNTVFTAAAFRTVINTTMLDNLTKIGRESDSPYGHDLTVTVFDWSKDGRYLLIGYNDYSLQCTDKNKVNSLTVFDIQSGNLNPLAVNNTSSIATSNGICTSRLVLQISQAKFSPDSHSVYYLLGGTWNVGQFIKFSDVLYKYDIDSKISQRPFDNDSGISWFNVSPNNSNWTLFYLRNGGVHFYPQDDPALSQRIEKILMNFGLDASGLYSTNADGTRFLFSNYLNSNSDERHLIELNTQTGETIDIGKSHGLADCIYPATFAPNDNLVVYVENSEMHCPLGGFTLHVGSLDGYIDDTVYGTAFGGLGAVSSPDGNYLATMMEGPDNVLTSHDTLYLPRIVIIQLAKAIPEFPIALFVFVIPLAIIVTLTGRFRNWNGR